MFPETLSQRHGNINRSCSTSHVFPPPLVTLSLPLSLWIRCTRLTLSLPLPPSPCLSSSSTALPPTPSSSWAPLADARWWPEGAWHGGQRPSVLIRGVWHHGTALACWVKSCRHGKAVCNNSPVCHQSRPSWLAGWRGHCCLPAVKLSEGEGKGFTYSHKWLWGAVRGPERQNRWKSYTSIRL